MPALAWKDYRYVAGGNVAFAVKVILGVGTIAIAYAAAASQGNPAIPWQNRREMQFQVFSYCLLMGSGGLVLLSMAIDASRVFRFERMERTLTSLLTLPLSTKQIILQKVRGSLANSSPLLVSLVIGLVCFGTAAVRLLARETYWSFEPVFYTVCFTLHGLFTFALLPVFVAWLSLRVRWGAFLIGGAIWFAGSWLLAAVCVLTFEEASSVILPCTAAILLGSFGISIPRRLEQLAAEE